MSETPKKGPLMRFAPVKNVQRIPKQAQMTHGVSMPADLHMLDKPKKRTVQFQPRKREEVVINLKAADVISNRRIGGSVQSPVFSFSGMDKDNVEIDSSAAVQIPLVDPNEKSKTATEILTCGDHLILLQIPSELPIKYPNNGSQMEANPLCGATDGHIGKLYVHKSGKVTAKIGNVYFEVCAGKSMSCTQMLVHQNGDQLEYVPIPSDKLVMSLDAEKMLEDIANEQVE